VITSEVETRQPPHGRWRGRILLLVASAVWLGTAYWQTHKPLAPGTRVASASYVAAPNAVKIMADVTAADAYGRPIVNQAIFDETLRVIGAAREFIVVDYVLVSAREAAQARLVAAQDRGPYPPAASALPLRPRALQLRDALIARKSAVPALRVLLITDPGSDAYGRKPSQNLALLRAAGIDVVVTDLDALRDSNFLYSSLWRITMRWWSGSAGESGRLAAWARFANFKANRRNLIIADDGAGRITGMLSSASQGDDGSVDSALAVEVSGPVLAPLIASELAIARFSGWEGADAPRIGAGVAAATERQDAVDGAERAPGTAAVRVQVLTEGAIRDALLEHVDAAGAGTTIDIAVLYLSDRPVIDALLAASRRGAAVRLILDPNAAAFGRPLSGVPNQPAASELVAASDGGIRVRWYRTHGERFHTALAVVHGLHDVWFTAGSASLTRRSLDDYDLVANVAVEAARGAPLAEQALTYFDALWSNRAPLGTEYTTDVAVFADSSQLSYWRYRIMEELGFSRF